VIDRYETLNGDLSSGQRTHARRKNLPTWHRLTPSCTEHVDPTKDDGQIMRERMFGQSRSLGECS